MVRFETLKNTITNNYRNYIKQKNFEFISEVDSGELWHGTIQIPDSSIKSDLCICFPFNFPYEHPWVYAFSNEEFIKNSRHQNDKHLCLWNDGEWNANITPDEFYDRIVM